jgi:hypothetical protein
MSGDAIVHGGYELGYADGTRIARAACAEQHADLQKSANAHYDRGRRDCEATHRAPDIAGLVRAVAASSRIRWRRRGRAEGVVSMGLALLGLAVCAGVLAGRRGR